MLTPNGSPHPFQPRAQDTLLRRTLWLLPVLLSSIFVLCVGAWAQINDSQERSAYRETLIGDASSVESQLAARQDAEHAKLREVATQLGRAPAGRMPDLGHMPGVVAGLDRLWNRLVWIDANTQVIAHVERKAALQASVSEDLRIEGSGQAAHISVPVIDAAGRTVGSLLARYDSTDLLRSTDLVWLNNRYEVGFVSDLGESIATTARWDRRPQGEVFERPLASSKDTILRLTPFEALQAWWQSPRTLALLGGLLLLGAGGSLLLRRQMARVARAVTAFQTEAAWRQAMEDSALVGLRARDAEGRILYVNKTLCEMVGYSSTDLMGLLPPLPFWPPEAVDAMMARNLSTLAGGAPSQGFETRWRHRDGHLLDVVIFESRLVNAEGAHIGWMGSIVDISERKRLEEADRQHREALAQHARLNDMGLLASELAHELNQPLTTIVSYSAGLSLAIKKQKLDDPDVREAVDEVNRHARKAGDIVNWIRRQTSRAEPEMAPHAINTLITDMLALRSRKLQRAGVQVSTELAPALVATRLDGVGIERVLANLVKNACDALAGQDGPRRLTLRSSRGALRDGQAAICVAVQDNGPGLQGKTLDTLCGTFYSTKSDGMGLGLGICRSIIESHGGSFHAEDAPGGGAVFRFLLPLHAPTPTATLTESP